ncbi:TPA: branched-chain amino acid ABC transporter permease [Burkholderia aenigmatica]|uniref:branched-chain amino acid ABC transporter permease n=1 Tax=Burkholderia sp. AU45251 TaxID=3059204 RepID=UPI00264A652A|nr:branched-chain amino acid ABC transporter permease [Burkholderia sp. AU45251]HDR9481982.1 branched-chain amino acid ABC transporter permease [Burkholderia aenigmatica]MDN7515386.1 branched-chain amino acid ABC transporter permease [Burkholderia sp. AU45251]HDR9515449.1 branched-chain amino acid ABC transporter permease [Burkholderia aenigmatica]HDR9590353.1 branched-chain amino acid ABC transporter permease [Burkholderia aenigmatica]HDR9598726.1 branched-chain amino acid ABC transporter per
MTNDSVSREPSRPPQLMKRHSATADLMPVLVACILLLVAGIAVPQMGDYALEVGFRLLLLIAIAEAWNLMAGYGGMVSLGTAAFFGAGAYALTGLVNVTGLPFLVALPLTGLVGAGLALAVSRAVFRLRGLYFTVGTLALAEALRLFMINYNGFGGASGIFLSKDTPGLHTLFLMAIGLLVVTIVAMDLATRSRFSILLRAVRDDEDAAAQIGVRTFRIKLAAFVVSSFLTSVAGGLQALKLGTVEPYGAFGVQWTVSALSIVIIGGQGLRAGPAVGAIFVVALGELLADWPALHLALTGAILILVIRFAPQGLAGVGQTIFKGRGNS